LQNKFTMLYSAKNLIFKKLNDFYLVFNPDAPNLVVVDEIGKAILESCKNGYYKNQLKDYICKKFSCDVESFDEFIQSLMDSGFIGKGKPPIFKLTKRAPTLKSMVLHLTQECNLRCKHCFFSSGLPYEDELSEKDISSIMKEFSLLGGESLIITGGEPFIKRSLLFELIKKARLQGVKHISISTNGTLLTEEDAAFLREHRVEVGISLDGFNMETNDFIRGQGTYEKAIKAIKLLTGAGVHTTIGVTLMKPNINAAENFIKLAKSLGVPSVSFTLLRIKGRAKANENMLKASPEEKVTALKKIWKASRDLKVKTTVEQMWGALTELTPKNLCSAGRFSVCVAPNGDVYPCDAIMEEPFKAGNLRKQNLREIWEHSEVFKLFRSLSVNDIEGCCECELKYVCGGGCLADNYSINGVLNKSLHDNCRVLKEIYWFMLSELAKDMWKELTN